MKISDESYRALEATILPFIERNPNAYRDYKEKGLSDMRFNFDVLYASGFDCRVLYNEGLNDTHIGTALAKILGNTGLNAKGKR